MPTPKISALLKLQALDMRCRDLKLRATSIPKELDKIIARRDSLNAATAAAADKVKKMELAIKAREGEIQTLNAESTKLQQQSALVKKNNEYQAMLAGIAQNKEKIGAIEEDLLIKFDELEVIKAEAERVRRTNAAELRAARQEFEELLGFSKTCEAEVAKLIKERPALLSGIPTDLLSRYERLLKGKDQGAPLVQLENGCCGNCHMRVTLQTLNQLSKGELESCDNCQHLIYTED
ncbi:MAG: hypothetical protein E7042_00460 [Lentisphaerae bacterium]|nr:hypothetical protein [Lentisphaerota bacterium]